MTRSSSLFMLLAFLLIQSICLGQYTKLFDFEYNTTGAYPYFGALITDGTYLYGTTSNGGDDNNGVVFKIKKDGSDFAKLHDFNEEDGYVPESSLLFVGDYLYGTTKFGGTTGDGTVFRIKPDGTGFSTIVSFDEDVSGREPNGSLFYDGTFLYGMASGGGVNSGGTIYKLAPDGSAFTTIFDFSIGVVTGNSPYGHLISDGTYLYGMTVGGGPVNQGVAFKIKPDGTDYTHLVEFTDDPTGSWGYGGMVLDATGYLYAMTNNGGEDNRGTIFKVKTDGTGYEKLLDMDNDNGAQPLGSLILVDTTLYGMTELSGNDAKGNVFSIEKDGSNFTTLVDFDGDNGSTPYGTLLYEDGALYGMTGGGGLNNRGVIFRYGGISSPQSVPQLNTAGVSLYPNPAHGSCSIDIPEPGADYTLELLNAYGSVISTAKLQAGSSSIDLHTIPPGVYIVKLYKDTRVFVEKLVVE